MTITHTFTTSDGPLTVDAAEPIPGLHVYEIPANVSPESAYRWILAHHDGRALASFRSSEEATTAAGQVAPLADWTRNAMTAANEISLGGRTSRLLELLQAAGGQHPNA